VTSGRSRTPAERKAAGLERIQQYIPPSVQEDLRLLESLDREDRPGKRARAIVMAIQNTAASVRRALRVRKRDT
jgi:hypothetical protein